LPSGRCLGGLAPCHLGCRRSPLPLLADFTRHRTNDARLSTRRANHNAPSIHERIAPNNSENHSGRPGRLAYVTPETQRTLITVVGTLLTSIVVGCFALSGQMLSFAYHLQVLQGDQDIVLPVELMGRLLDCTPTFISRF